MGNERIDSKKTIRTSANTPSRALAGRGFSDPAPSSAGSGGHSIGKLSVLRPQAKLTVNTPGDSFEHEADTVARKVVSMPESQVQRRYEDNSGDMIQRSESSETEDEDSTSASTSTPTSTSSSTSTSTPSDTESESSESEGEELQLKPAGPTPGATDVSHNIKAGISGGGKPLDPATRAFMEPRFGHDFSQVRVHTDDRASDSAQSVAARAFTFGSDIGFRKGAFDPGSSSGKELLAHELTHVVQQGKAPEKGEGGE